MTAAGGDDNNKGLLDLYPWEGATESEVEIACAQIARRLLHRGVRLIGFVAAPGAPPLIPLLVRIGCALVQFQRHPVGVIGPWVDWDGTAEEAGSLDPKGHGPALRTFPGEAAPNLVVPPRAPDAETAALSLQLALRRIEGRFAQVLVDLTGWSDEKSGELSVMLGLMTGVAIVGATGRTTLSELGRAGNQIPSEKNLGAVLVG